MAISHRRDCIEGKVSQIVYDLNTGIALLNQTSIMKTGIGARPRGGGVLRSVMPAAYLVLESQMGAEDALDIVTEAVNTWLEKLSSEGQTI